MRERVNYEKVVSIQVCESRAAPDPVALELIRVVNSEFLSTKYWFIPLENRKYRVGRPEIVEIYPAREIQSLFRNKAAGYRISKS